MSYESLEELLKNDIVEDLNEIQGEVTEKELEKNNEIEAKLTSGKKKNRIITLSIVAVIMSAITAISVFSLKNKKNNNKEKIDIDKAISNTITGVSDLENINNNENSDTIKLEDLDVELDVLEDLNSDKKEYSNPTGNVNVNEIVQDNNTKEIWSSQSAQQNSVNIGSEVFDTKDDTLEVKPNGNVYEKNIGYEIKDQNSNIISSGDYDNGKIPGYVKDESTGDQIKVEDINTYTDPDGNLWESKEQYENYLKLLESQNESKETIIIPVENQTDDNLNIEQDVNLGDNSNISQTPEQGKINPDGTYTIFGITYDSKADYQAYIMGEEGYIIVGDRVIYNGQKEKSKTKELIK